MAIRERKVNQKNRVLDEWFSVQNMVGIVCVALSLIWIFYYNMNKEGLLSSDMSSELVLANLLSKENALLSNKWIYSTELRVVNTQVVYSILFHFFIDWSLVRALGTLIMLIGLVISGCFMLYMVGINKKNILFTVSFLIMPFSSYQYLIILVGAYYIPHLTISFLIVGCFYGIINKKPITNICFAGGVFLSVAAGLGGIRYFLIVFIPLLAACIWEWLIENEEVKKIDRIMVATLFSVCGAVGYRIYSKVLAQKYNFDSYSSISFINVNDEDIGNRVVKMIAAVLETISGYQSGTKVFSLAGISNCFVVGYIAIIFMMTLYIGMKGKKHFLFYTYIVMLVAFNTFIMLFTDVGFSSGVFVSRYYGLALTFLFFIIPIYCEVEANNRKKIVYMACIMISLVVDSFVNTLQIQATDLNVGRRGAITYLKNNDLNFGYATFWNANVTTELTDGEINLAPIYSAKSMKSFEYLMKKEYLNIDYIDSTRFILLTREEYNDEKECSVIEGGRKEYEDDFFVVLTYHNSEELYGLAANDN